MSTSSQLSRLLERWRKLQEQGQTVSAEELGRDCPELIPELKQQIEAFQELGPLLQIRVNRRGAQETQQDSDTQKVLRGRLLMVCLLFLIPTVILRVFITLDNVFYPDTRPFDSLTYYPEVREIDALYYVIIAGMVVPLMVLLGRWRLSLLQLRLIEAFLFGFAVAALVWAQFRWYQSGWLQSIAYPGKERRLMVMAGDSISFSWFLLVVLYGTCVPNSGRRCAGAVGLMIAAALVFTFLSGGRDAWSELYLNNIIGKMGLWMATAAVIAIYGSHRLDVLRRQAFEARKLGQYVIKKRLGAGGMGEVYLAEHQFLRRLCAVKLIRMDRSADSTNLLRFQREVQLTATLTHSSIVEIFDYGQTDDGLFYYVMEYLPGLSLQELIDRFGPLPPERVVHLLRQICWGLREAHASGLIHRDIKPSNIIVCERGRVPDVAKLVDFGLVKDTVATETLSAHDIALDAGGHKVGGQSSEVKGQRSGVGSQRSEVAAPLISDLRPLTSDLLTEVGAVVGTPHYMSPEQINGTMALDGRSDLYSLGVVAYYALTREHPFAGASYRDIIAAHLCRTPMPLIDVCPAAGQDMSQAIMRCLEKERDDRFADAESLEQALAACACANRWTLAQADAWWRKNVKP